VRECLRRGGVLIANKAFFGHGKEKTKEGRGALRGDLDSLKPVCKHPYGKGESGGGRSL